MGDWHCGQEGASADTGGVSHGRPHLYGPPPTVHTTVVTTLHDADACYLEEIAEDCASLLGPGIELLSVEPRAGRRRTRLVARYKLGDRVGESVGTGSTLLAAHVALREQPVEGRLALGFSAIVVDRRR